VLKKRVYFAVHLMVFARKHLVGLFQLMPLLADMKAAEFGINGGWGY
jgi:hypothetical protein